MAIKIGINGMGRIGRLVFRYAALRDDIDVVHVNDRMPMDLLVHLIKYDTVHGKFPLKISNEDNNLVINGKKIIYTTASTPTEIPWKSSEAEIVVDSSGKFPVKRMLEGHLSGKVRKVILSCPANDDSLDRTVVLGVNEREITHDDIFISNASCTTNCAAITLNVLSKTFGIKRAFMNTVHPFTNNQNLLDGPHKDFRRARAAMNNIIPTSTSAIKAVPLVMPELIDRFDGFATRVPVADCSFVEITAELNRNTTIDEINKAFKKYSTGTYGNYLEYCDDPIVSSDILSNTHSAIYDALATKILLGDMVQILAWYDNESGYSSRILDLVSYIS